MPTPLLLAGLVIVACGLWVPVARVSESQGDVTYGLSDQDGRFILNLEPGAYILVASMKGFEPVELAVTHPAAAPVTLQLAAPLVQGEPGAEVINALRAEARALHGIDPNLPMDDLAALQPALASARIVALGEATHGSHELFVLKHRLVRFLVERMGFNTFAIEAGFSAALKVNDYVLWGKGDSAAAIAGLHVWTWDTEEVAELVQWMRGYNQDPLHRRKVKFVGLDMQFSSDEALALATYLGKLDPALAASLKPLEDRSLVGRDDPLPIEKGKALLQIADAVCARLGGQQGEEGIVAVRQAAILRQSILAMIAPSHLEGAILRDAAMAANALWLLENQGPAGKMILWAHNAHVATRGYPAEYVTMGASLREALGPQLYVIGLLFNQGALRARSPGVTDTGVLVHQVPPAPSASVEGVLARVGLPLFAVDLRASALELWKENRGSRSVGSLYAPKMPLEAIIPRATYDGIIFVDRITASRPTRTGERRPR